MLRGRKLGTRRINRYLCDEDVNVRAIPWLSEPHEIRGPEELQIGGDAPKDFVIIKSGKMFDNAYIAKCPRKQGAKECVTEYLIACIGQMLPFRKVRARLVRMPPPPDVRSDVRFMSRYFLTRKNEALMHGIEAVAKCFEMEEKELVREIPRGKPQERRFYTVDLIVDVLAEVANSDDERDRLVFGFCRMMAFDALVGANDRHPKNWGLVYDAANPTSFLFSPVFDTARGLFWNYSDEQLANEDARGRRDEFIRSYALHSKPLVSARVAGDSSHPDHFEVIDYMMKAEDGAYRPPIRQIIGAFHPDKCTKMLHQKFGRLFSRRRLEYIDALLRHRYIELKKICKL